GGVIARRLLLGKVEPGHFAQQPSAQRPGTIVFASDRKSCLGHRISPVWPGSRTTTIISQCSKKCTTLLPVEGAMPAGPGRGGGRGDVRLYQAYQAPSDVMVPVRSWAASALSAIGQPSAGFADN